MEKIRLASEELGVSTNWFDDKGTNLPRNKQGEVDTDAIEETLESTEKATDTAVHGDGER